MLVDFLRANADIFAWSPSDMPVIPREVAEHSLDILPNSKPVKQRLRRFDELKLMSPTQVGLDEKPDTPIWIPQIPQS